MEVRKISVVDAISFAFRAMLDHIRLFFFVFLVGTGLIAVVVGIIGFFNMGLLTALADTPMFQSFQECVGTRCFTVVYQSGWPFVQFVVNHALPLLLSGFLLSLFFVGLDLGFKAIALDVYDTNQGKVETLWSRFNLVLTGFCAWTLYCTMMWIGFLFFIVPGIIVLLRFGFFPFLIIDKHLSIIDSLKQSYEITREHIWDLFAFWVVIKIIMYVGSLTYIGIIVTWPLSTLAYAYVYRQLMPKMQ